MTERDNREVSGERGWMLRNGSGPVRNVRSLTHIAMLLLDGKLGPDTEVSLGDGGWVRLSHVVDTHGLAATLEALGHLGGRRGDADTPPGAASAA